MADAYTLHAIEVTQKRLCRPPTSRPQVFQAFLHGSARINQNTRPRIAASEQWKIGRVRITALVCKNRFST
jgi:hypothetical protein